MATLLFESDAATEERMQAFARTLSEKDRRRFAALEATQRGYGGITYIAGVPNCSQKTIERGIAELDQLADDPDDSTVLCTDLSPADLSISWPGRERQLDAMQSPHGLTTQTFAIVKSAKTWLEASTLSAMTSLNESLN